MTSPRHIFVVHGALGSAAQMEPIASALRELGEVHNIELPGHGRTPLRASEPFSIADFSEHLRTQIQVVRASSGPDDALPTVFGYSMGGYVALALEAASPGTLAAIVTFGTKFAWTPALALRELSRLDPDIIAEKIPKFAAMLAARHEMSSGWKQVLEHTGMLLTALGDAPVLTRETLGTIRSQVTIAVGDRDDTVSADEATQYAAFMPNAVARVVPDAPHPIERVPVDQIVSLVRETINR